MEQSDTDASHLAAGAVFWSGTVVALQAGDAFVDATYNAFAGRWAGMERSDPLLLVSLSRVLGILGAWAELETLEATVDDHPYAPLHTEIGVGRLMQGDLDGAARRLQLAATLPIPEPTAWNSLARVLAQKGDWDNALLAIDLGRAALPADPITARTAQLLQDLHERGAARMERDRFPWRARLALQAAGLLLNASPPGPVAAMEHLLVRAAALDPTAMVPT